MIMAFYVKKFNYYLCRRGLWLEVVHHLDLRVADWGPEGYLAKADERQPLDEMLFQMEVEAEHLVLVVAAQLAFDSDHSVEVVHTWLRYHAGTFVEGVLSYPVSCMYWLRDEGMFTRNVRLSSAISHKHAEECIIKLLTLEGRHKAARI
jgi:hypothetical protein